MSFTDFNPCQIADSSPVRREYGYVGGSGKGFVEISFLPAVHGRSSGSRCSQTERYSIQGEDVIAPSATLFGVIQKGESSRFLGGESRRTDRWYSIGDLIDGFEVRQSLSDSVLVSKQGIDFTLSFQTLSGSRRPDPKPAQILRTTMQERREALVSELTWGVVREKFNFVTDLGVPEEIPEELQIPDSGLLSIDLSEKITAGLFQFNLLLDSLRTDSKCQQFSTD